ncbi:MULTISPECIES: Csu type fimbrial protein [Pseudomonas]|uniref:Spore coat protein U domain-containing protein n=1 Tax=Pseudomonas weihenstephanensis TaxID=1608994 RepID=A0ABS1ZLX6_9PSED|nr:MULTISPECIES: spore coat U domain-containing protein [Pseudomonas]KVV04741.1 putative secreted protein [Pseudomonas sp. TAD18]KVV06550.1 putative secreted protein [Pseudomonas sp. TAA207]MBM1197487.1 spore coat protein U domain-containing protein [Pseudomonas weihenstephanensis]
MAGSAQVLMLCGAWVLLIDSPQAALLSGQIQARLVIRASCEVSAGNSADPEQITRLGTLDFGAQGPTWKNPIDSQLQGSESSLAVSCNPAVKGFTVTIDGGSHGDGTTRQLSNGRQLIPYRLSLDAAGSDSYSIGQQRNFSISNGGQVPIPVYGLVMANPNALPAGVYRDTLRVTLDW